MEFNTVIQNRYSCRAFAARAVEQEKVDRILEAGRIAPTALNKQPVHVWAVTNPGTLEAIKGVTRSNYGAPLLLIVGCRPFDAWVRRYDGKNGSDVDATMVGSIDPAFLKGILPGTDGYELVAVINVGYPAEESAPSAMHESRIPMREFVTRVD